MSAIAAPTDAQSTRDALGGRWATSLTLWGILLIPAIALSAYQANTDAYPNVLLGAVAVLGPCATPILVFVLARALRRNTETIPIGLCLVYWAAVGVVHGLTAGWLYVVLAGGAAHYPAQMMFWAGACILWLPLVTYGIAQSAYRRRLLISLQSEIRRYESLRRSSLVELADLRDLIVHAIQENIRPVLVTISTTLDSFGPALDGARLADLGGQLAAVSEETTRLIATTARREGSASAAAELAPDSPVGAALDFPRARPLMGAVLTSVALLPLVVAISFRTADVNTAALETEIFILLLLAVLLYAASGVQRLAYRLEPMARVGVALAAYVMVGIAGAVVAAVGPWQPTNQQNLLLALLLPLAVPLAALALSSAVGVGNANLDVAARLRSVRNDITEFEALLEGEKNEIRGQVAALTHGPLRGRLAACAMALNFHAAEIGTSTPERTEYIITSVRQHLNDVLAELDSLG